MPKPTRTAEQLQQLLFERLEAISELRGQLTDAHRGRVVGTETSEGGPNWTVFSFVDIDHYRADIARIIRSLQMQFDLEE